MIEILDDISPKTLRHANRSRQDGLPARDMRHVILDADLVQLKPAEAAPAEPEADHSAHYEDPEETSHSDRYNAKPYGPGYIERYGQKKSEPHPLDDESSREAWTYGDPAKVARRLHGL